MPDASGAGRGRLTQGLAIAVALLAALAFIYGQTARHGFVRFDDEPYISGNPAVLAGLSRDGIVWALGIHAANWHPLTWISHMIDAELFGAWAGGHHLHSAVLHGVNALLLALVLTRMTGALWRSAVVAALFALHPLRVESVAWASERKDVLCALFWFLAVGAHLRYVRRPTTGRYATSVGLFVLGLAAKPMVITLPLVLLILDWWPLGRLRAARQAAGPLLEKVPFLALSAGSAFITVLSQLEGVRAPFEPSLPARIANAVVSVAAYVGQSLWPAGLAVLYPFPLRLPWPGLVAAAALLATVVAAALLTRRSRPVLLFGVLWYLVMLLPVLGIVQVGAQARADRYTYLPMIGPTVAAVWLAARVRLGGAVAQGVRAALACGILVAFCLAARFQTGLWRDSLTLFEHAAGVTADNYRILTNLGDELNVARRFDEARRVLGDAVRANPNHCNAHYTLGNSFYLEGRFDEALGPYQRSLRCYAAQRASSAYIADVHTYLANAYLGLERYREAELHFLSVLSLRPDDATAAGQLVFVRAAQRLADP